MGTQGDEGWGLGAPGQLSPPGQGKGSWPVAWWKVGPQTQVDSASLICSGFENLGGSHITLFFRAQDPSCP